MKKILTWDDEKDAFVLESLDACLKNAEDYAIDYYGKNIYWSSDEFDKLFIPTAKLHAFASVLDSRVRAIQDILADFELISKKITIIEEELSKKESDSSNEEAPF